MTRERATVIRYTIGFKQKVVREIEEEGLTFSNASRRYGIKGGTTIQKWVKQFGKYHLLSKHVRIETMEEKDRIKQLEQEVTKLKMALADSTMAQRCLEVLIDEANKEYQTDLKKSFGEGASAASKKNIR
jgi:transposase